MSDPAQALRDFTPTREFFVGIDSDGCVFDSMEIKHKECFTPMFIKHFGLQAVSRYAREVWDFVNLYSKTRGCNRYPALSNALNFLAERPEVRERGNAALAPVLAWSEAVDAQIADIVHGVPPFPLVHEALAKLGAQADMMVISQTPTPALEREWAENDLRKYVHLIAGQEMGSKKDHLKLAAAGKYPGGKILMIGDAPGDFTAAKSNGALFYPIIPGREEASWERLLNEAADAFLGGAYAGEYEAALVKEFQASLPERPGWK